VKIVFIQPRLQFRSDAWEAGGIGSLISYAEQSLPEINLDFSFYSGFYDTDEEIIEGCKNADVVGFGASSPQFKHAINLARQIKTSNNKIVFGGFHVTTLPELALRESVIDAIIIGEGELAFTQLVRDIYNNRLKEKVYKFPLIENLDKLPFPERFIIKSERNIQQAYNDEGRRVTSVLTSRGCPYRCAFCSGHSIFGSKTRFRSVINFLDEVRKVIKDWNIDFLKFSDETFTLGKERMNEFCEQKKSKGIDVPFGANAHPASLTVEILKDLASVGCKELWFGVESGSPKILKDMKKDSNLERIRVLFKEARKVGIKRRAYILLGMPNETLEDIKMTEDFCDEIDPDIVGFTLLAPYPINEFFNYEEMKDWDWSMIDHYVHNNWAHTKTLSNEDLKEIQKRLTEKYSGKLSFRQKNGKIQDRYTKDVRGKIAPEDSNQWKCNWMECLGGCGLAGNGNCSEKGEWNKSDCKYFKRIPDYMKG
jgi:radical SAM superfamily enzyme YgiQ (UPF0313 family)